MKVLAWLRELRDLLRFLFATPAHDRRIVFYAEHESYYVFYEGILDALKTKDFGPVCYVTSDRNDPVLSTSDPSIRTFYQERLLPLFMAVLNCRVCVMTMAELGLPAIPRSANKNVHYAYVFHAAHSANATYEFGAFKEYDSMLCVGPHQVRELRKQEQLYGWKTKDLIEGGYYRIERIHARYRAAPRLAGAPMVLFAPSWESSNVLQTYCEAVVRSLRDAGYRVTLRPHPETIRRYAEWWRAAHETYAGDEGVFLEESVSGDESLIQAVALITDWSGIALEYAYGTERPVLYLDIPQKVVNQRFEELELEANEVVVRREVGIIVPIEDLPNIARYVQRALDEQGVYRERILKLREEYLFAWGESGRIGADHLIAMCELETRSRT